LMLFFNAICIDQGNAKEKNHHVGLMLNIYRNASRVRAWVDQSLPTNSQNLKNALSRLVDLSAEKNPSASSFTKHVFRIRNDMLILFGFRFQISPNADALSEWRRVAKIFENEYWCRLWIQQELLLPNEVVFHFRQTPMPGSLVFSFRRSGMVCGKAPPRCGQRTTRSVRPIFHMPTRRLRRLSRPSCYRKTATQRAREV
jgi:hypothetical protein